MDNETTNKVYGIDLGTTYSVISHLDDMGRISIIGNKDGEQITDSAVFFESEKDWTVGTTARNSSAADPDNFVGLIKREMGTNWEKVFYGKKHTPVTISALILKYMVESAEMQGCNVKDVVITCPAYFNEAERAATKAAGEVIGLNVLAVLDEPIAAALSYGFGAAARMMNNEAAQDAEPKQIIVYDLGGGTFDVSVVSISPSEVRVICSDGDHRLGGADWDEVLKNIVIAKLGEQSADVEQIRQDAELLAELNVLVERMKKSLTQRDSAAERVRMPDGSRLRISVTREEFEAATLENLLQRTAEFTDKMIELAREKSGVEKIDEFLLVGGSTFMPQVQEMVNTRYASALGVEPKMHEPNFAVSKGATVYGLVRKGFTIRDGEMVLPTPEPVGPGGVDLPVRGTSPITIRTVASKSIGIKVRNKVDNELICYNLLTKQTDLPACKTQTFPVSAANASILPLDVYSNDSMEERADLDFCTCIGQAEMELTPGLPAGAPIEITFELDNEGRLQLTAKDVTNGKELKTEIATTGLSMEELEDIKRTIGELTV